jgi:hypothetical protein
MTIDALPPALARLATASDSVRSIPMYVPPLLNGDTLDLLTQSSVPESDLHHARMLLGQVVRDLPTGWALNRQSVDARQALSAYETAAREVCVLLRDLSGTPPAWDTSRPDLPPSMRSFAIARTGILNRVTIDSECERHGFQKRGHSHVHEDGSWANLVLGSTVELGWKGYDLGDLGWRYAGAAWH